MVSRSRKIALWWNRAGFGTRAVLVIVFMLLLGMLVYVQRPASATVYQSSNLLIFSLVNFNILILCVLAFLVGRNIVKLIFDRKNKIFGSGLRMRLVVALVGMTLVPTSILFALASGLLNQAMEGWLSNQVEASASGALRIAKFYYQSQERALKNSLERVTIDFQLKQLANQFDESLRSSLESIRNQEGLYSIRVLEPGGQVILEVQNAAANISDFSEPHIDVSNLEKANAGKQLVLFEREGVNQYLRSYSSTLFRGKPVILVCTNRLRSDIAHSLDEVQQAFKEYEQLKLFQSPLKSSYLLTLALITCLILFSAIWFGFYIARQISVPIQRLAEATKAVARGNYDVQVRSTGDDELSFLVDSFNTMTRDLKHSRKDAEFRRRFIETVVENLAVGVLAIDANSQVILANKPLVNLLGLADADELLGKTLAELLKPQHVLEVQSLLDSLDRDQPMGELAMSFETSLGEVDVVCTAGRFSSSAEGKERGTLLIFDDVTELLKAQKMTAWREVARRIAHEIKNPLTPIQLSAQRIQKMVERGEAGSKLAEAAGIIVENVDSIKRLANEFSNFARMPTAEFEISNINLLVSDTMIPFAEAHGEIVFQFIADQKIPDIQLDREQIRRIIINIIDNSVAALQKARTEHPRVLIKTQYDRKRKVVLLEISDNGPGIPDADKARVFQPYFTTKEEGTGLGLAIVSSIVSDHQGAIRVYDSVPAGAKFIVELPISPERLVSRRFTTAG